MPIQRPFPLQAWLDENRHLLKPPVGNKRIWQDSEFIVMAVGGPNARQDFHYNEGEEFFYQLEGDIRVDIQENGQRVSVPIQAGEIFLLPAKIPHSPVRPEGSLGLVIERRRRSDEKDGLLWFCEKCNHKLYESYFHMVNIEQDFQGVFDRFYSNESLRTCSSCGWVMLAK